MRQVLVHRCSNFRSFIACCSNLLQPRQFDTKVLLDFLLAIFNVSTLTGFFDLASGTTPPFLFAGKRI